MAIIDDWRERVRQAGEDPFGDTPTAEISKKQLDKVMAQGDAEAAGIIQGAIEEFSQEFAQVIRRFLRLKNWKDVQRIAVGGGLRQSRIGELAIGRTAVILKASGFEVDLETDPLRARPRRPHRQCATPARPGFSPVTTASSPSTLAAVTSARALSS